jgi:acylglycerol lipase
MAHVAGTFSGPRGVDIFWQSWLPDGAPKGVVLLVHGLGEHSGRYTNVVHRLVPEGYAVYALDHMGHGQSQGAREVIHTFEDLTEPLWQFRQQVVPRHSGVPTFLLGHSMGGLIASLHALDHAEGLSGLVLSAPAVYVGEGVSALTIAMGKILSVVAPQVGVLPVRPEFVSRDPVVVAAYSNDPLVFHKKTPARLAAELLRSIKGLAPRLQDMQLPLLVMQGTADRLVDPKGASWFVESVSSADKTLTTYAGLYHEIFNEPEHAEVIGDLLGWLRQRTEPSRLLGRAQGDSAGQ